MDALKKAEEAKRLAEAAKAEAPPPGVENAGQEQTEGLPELPSRLELLDHEFDAATGDRQAPPAVAPASPPRPAQETLQGERAAAQNVFQAKQAPRRSNFLALVGLATVIAVLAIGGWVWWQMQPKGGLGPVPATARAPEQAPAPIAAAPAAPVQAEPAEPPAAATTPAASAEAADGGKASLAASADRAERSHAAPSSAVPASRRPIERVVQPVAPMPPAAEPERPIRITTARLRVNPQVASGYQAFQSGDLAAAQRSYQAVLKGEPKNIDALHGMAAISLLEGRPEAAEAYYLRVLDADPKDSAAQAGLIGLRGQTDPTQSESRLKNLLAGQPESPMLNFALGNLYAQEGRWNEAQQAYFRAYSADGDNPDYQFNLAVSLEQLRQPRLALQYYRGALSAAAQRPAAFDRNQVAGRISELQK